MLYYLAVCSAALVIEYLIFLCVCLGGLGWRVVFLPPNLMEFLANLLVFIISYLAVLMFISGGQTHDLYSQLKVICWISGGPDLSVIRK